MASASERLLADPGQQQRGLSASRHETGSPKFQVVIPRRVREQFGLTPGQTLQVIALPGP